MDPQASLTEYFNGSTEFSLTIYDALLHGTTVPLLPIGPLIDLFPANIDLAAAEIQLPAKRSQERTLERILRGYKSYDYTIIDCPPSLGVLTTNALTAASVVLVPVSTELMAERTIKLILQTVLEIRETELNPNLTIWRILATMYDSRLSHHKEILEALHVKYGKLLYSEPVRLTTKYKDAVTNQTDISGLDANLGTYWINLATTLIQGR